MNTFSNLINHHWVSICDKSWIFSIITPDFGVTWSFRNHSYMPICCSVMIICAQSLIMVLINIKTFLLLHIFVEITMHLIFQDSLFNRRLKIAFISGINTLLVASWYIWCCYKYKNYIFIIVCLFCEFLCLCCYTHLFWFLNESLSFTQTGCVSLNWCDCYGQSIIHHYLSSFTTNVIKLLTVTLTEIAQLHYTIYDFMKLTFSALSFTPTCPRSPLSKHLVLRQFRTELRRLPNWFCMCITPVYIFCDSKWKRY